jgi:alpha-galactosidase/6-phospho-beta-glucosidase family protein
MPEILRGLTDVHCRVQKMTLEAALTGNRKLAMEALMLDPLCAKLAPSDIRKMGLELMAATRAYLPQFR